MGFGFVLTIVLLGALLGLFARQALASTEESAAREEHLEDETPATHSHAI